MPGPSVQIDVLGRADGGDRVLVSGAQPAAVLEGAVRRFAVEA